MNQVRDAQAVRAVQAATWKRMLLEMEQHQLQLHQLLQKKRLRERMTALKTRLSTPR